LILNAVFGPNQIGGTRSVASVNALLVTATTERGPPGLAVYRSNILWRDALCRVRQHWAHGHDGAWPSRFSALPLQYPLEGRALSRPPALGTRPRRSVALQVIK